MRSNLHFVVERRKTLFKAVIFTFITSFFTSSFALYTLIKCTNVTYFSSMTDPEAVKKKRKLRFSCFDDINLLKQTIALNPYKNKKNWAVVHLNFIKTASNPFTMRAIRDHVEHLQMLYTRKELGTLRRGNCATEKQHLEKEQLLQQLCDLKEAFDVKRKKREKMQPQLISDSPFEIIKTKEEVVFESVDDPDLNNPSSSASTPTTVFIQNNSENYEMGNYSVNAKSSVSSSSIVRTFMDASTDPIFEILEEERNKELNFEKRKLLLEEKKVELESRRLALEEARMKYFLESQKQQHHLMSVLIEKITNNTNK